MKASSIVCAALTFLWAMPASHGTVTLPKIFSDNMVLQREKPVYVWGTAAAGDEVTVKFAGQEKHTQPGADGKWMVTLDPLKANATPQELDITATNAAQPASNGETNLKNILVGEVWFCGGQSNMEYSVNAPSSSAPSAVPVDPLLAKEIATETYPQIRLFRVKKQTAVKGIVTDNGWTDCAGTALNDFSAIGFFFARNLQRALGVPVGMVGSYWGGSRLEQWIPPEAFQKQPAFAKEAAAPGRLLIDGRAPGDYYASMIRDLAPFTVRGMLWYQGESNIIASNDGVRYADKMQALVDFWRGIWQDKDLPFYQVQIAPFLYTTRKDMLVDKVTPLPHGPDELPKLWEAQFLATRLRNVEIVPTTDLDSKFSNIHPNGKREVGQRLTNLALTKVYGQTTPAWQGPVFAGISVHGGTATVAFTNTDGKLSTRDGQPPAFFEIAGADGAFHPATATISGDTVTLQSSDVPAPVAARMGWTETAQPNLINKDGLPAYPFRSNGPDWTPAR
jgi:sialate O-acetylesterase